MSETVHPNDLMDQYDLARDEYYAAKRYWNELPNNIKLNSDYPSEAILKMFQDAQRLCKEKKLRMIALRNEVLLRLNSSATA